MVSETGNFITAQNHTVPLSDSGLITPFAVPTTDPNPSTDDSDSTITVTLLDRAGYSIADAPNHQAIATVIDDVPIISIESDAELTGVTEEDSFDFTVTSNRDLNGVPLDIEFTITDGGTGAIVSGTTVRIPGNARTATGTVTNIADVASNTNIVIAIRDSVDYDVSTSDPSITVAVKDNDTPSESNPTITIANNVNYIAEGSDATFTVEASQLPTNDTPDQCGI